MGLLFIRTKPVKRKSGVVGVRKANLSKTQTTLYTRPCPALLLQPGCKGGSAESKASVHPSQPEECPHRHLLAQRQGGQRALVSTALSGDCLETRSLLPPTDPRLLRMP